MLAQIDHKQKWMIAAIVAIAGVITGCGAGGGSVKGTTSASPAALTVSAVYPTSSGIGWSPVVLSNRYYIKGLSVSISGTCDRGISTIAVNEGAGNYAEIANCLADGSFNWSKTYTGPLDTDKTLTLQGYDTTNTLIAGTAVNAKVHIDNVPPVAPTVTTPPGSTYTHAGATGNFTFAGTVSADTYQLTVNGANLSFTGTSFTYPVVFVDGATSVWTFNAYDLAGNQSSSSTVTVTYAPSLKLGQNADFDVSGGLLSDSGTSGFHMEAASFMMPSTTTNSTMTLDTGFNFITNSERAN